MSGRDPGRCDLVFQDRSVSALHVEIFFDAVQHLVGVRSLRQSNPPLVDGRQLIQGTAYLHQNSRMQLGRIELTVTALKIAGNAAQAYTPHTPHSNYGLQCPNPACGKVSAYSSELLKQGCPWCGFSLAAANSVLVSPASF